MPRAVVEKFLAEALKPDHQRLVVACSGGLDSVCLLDIVAALRPIHGRPLHVIHVHHGISPFADEWAAFVQRRALACQADFSELRVQVQAGGSLEEAAREARYRAIGDSLVAGDVLLTAHHRNDQAETVLLRLLRGSGVTGLAAMHPQGRLPFQQTHVPLWRPLLTISRAELAAYARCRGLSWVEDDSNTDLRHSRNFLRNTVIPLLGQRWPRVAEVLSETAVRMRESEHLLNELASLDLQVVGREGNTLSIPDLMRFDDVRRMHVLRFWLRRLNLEVPDRAGLRILLREVCAARPDGAPRYVWRHTEVRRYRDRLYAMPLLEEMLYGPEVVWSDRLLPLPLRDGRILTPQAGEGQGASLAKWLGAASVIVGVRRGGERILLPGREGRKELKTLFQEAGIPPWQREHWPLIYVDGELAVVPGLWVSAALQARDDEASIRIT